MLNQCVRASKERSSCWTKRQKAACNVFDWWHLIYNTDERWDLLQSSPLSPIHESWKIVPSSSAPSETDLTDWVIHNSVFLWHIVQVCHSIIHCCQPTKWPLNVYGAWHPIYPFQSTLKQAVYHRSSSSLQKSAYVSAPKKRPASFEGFDIAFAWCKNKEYSVWMGINSQKKAAMHCIYTLSF